MTVNRRIVAWFESGRAVEALLGSEGCFIPDNSFRERHNDLLVLRQLIAWARANGRPADAAAAFTDAMTRAVADQDPASVYGLVWCLLLVSDGRELELPLEVTELDRQLDLADGCSDALNEEDAKLRPRVRAALSSRS